MDSPSISVLLPTYNRASELPRSIKSVQLQTVDDLELIVIDDGSTDETEQLIKSYDDPRFRYLKHDSNRGVPKALNTGLEKARGKYIALQNSDDYWFPKKLEKSLSVFNQRSNNLGMVFNQHVCNDSRNFKPSDQYFFEWLGTYSHLILTNFIPGLTVMRTSALREIGGYDETLSGLEDWDLWIRLSKKFSFHYIPEPLHFYETSGKSESQDTNKRKHSLRDMFEKYGEEFKRVISKQERNFINNLQSTAENRPLFVWGTGEAGLRTVDFLKKSSVEIAGVIDSELDEDNKTIRGLPVKSFEKIAMDESIQNLFILVESKYYYEIVPVLTHRGFQEKSDFYCNYFRPLLFGLGRKVLLAGQ